MRLRLLAAMLTALALGGCGSAAHPTDGVVSRAEQAANVCGTLRARLQGIAHVADIVDPQNATLEGRRPAEAVARADAEAIAASREVEAGLHRVGAPTASIETVERAEASYASFARSLRGVTARDSTAGLHIATGYLRRAALEYAGCMRAVQSG